MWSLTLHASVKKHNYLLYSHFVVYSFFNSDNVNYKFIKMLILECYLAVKEKTNNQVIGSQP